MEVAEGEERIYEADDKSRLEQLAEPKSNFDSTKFNFPINQDPQATIRPILTKTLTSVPSERLRELACPKWPFFIYYGAEPFQFIRRENLEVPEDYLFDPEDVLGFMSRHRQIQSYWPSTIANFIPILHPMKQKEPRLVTFPKPMSATSIKPCSQRISALAQPRQNSLEILKKQSDRVKKIYTVSKSALKAVPSPRIIALATPKPDSYLEALKQEAIEAMKSKDLRQKKERSGRDERSKKSKGSKQIQDSSSLPAKMVRLDKKVRKSLGESITEKREMPIIQQKKEIAGKRMDDKKSKVRAASRKLSLRKSTDASKQREKTEVSFDKENITEDKKIVAFKLDEKEKKRKESKKKERKESIKDKFSEEYLRQLPKPVSEKQPTSLAEAEKTVTDVVKPHRVKKQEAEKIDAVKPSTTKKKQSEKTLITVVKPDTMKVQEKLVPGKKEKKERKQSVKKIPKELPQTKLSISEFPFSSNISDLSSLEIGSEEQTPVGKSIVADRQGVTDKDHEKRDETQKEMVQKTKPLTKPKPPKRLVSKPTKVKLSKKESTEKNLSKSFQELSKIRKESAPISADERKEKVTVEDATQHKIKTDVISSVPQPKPKYSTKEREELLDVSEAKDIKDVKRKSKLLSKENGNSLTKQEKPIKKTKMSTEFDKDKDALDTKTLEVIKIDETGLVDKGIKQEIELSEISLKKKSRDIDQKTIENHLQDKDHVEVVDEKLIQIGKKVKECAEVTAQSKEHDTALDTRIGGTDDISKSEKKKFEEQLTGKVEVTKNTEDKKQKKLLDGESAQHDTFGVAIENGIMEKENKDMLKDSSLEITKVNEASIVMPTEVSNLEKQQDQTQLDLEISSDLPEEKNIPEPQASEISVEKQVERTTMPLPVSEHKTKDIVDQENIKTSIEHEDQKMPLPFSIKTTENGISMIDELVSETKTTDKVHIETSRKQEEYTSLMNNDTTQKQTTQLGATIESSKSTFGDENIFGDTRLESKTAEPAISKMSIEDQQMPTELYPSAFSDIESLKASTEKKVEDEKEKEAKPSAAFDEAIATKTKDTENGKELPSEKKLSTQDKNILDEKGIIDVELDTMTCGKEPIEDSISDDKYIATTNRAIEETVESPAMKSLDSAENKDIFEEEIMAITEDECIKEEEIKRSEKLNDLLMETAKDTREVTSPKKSLTTVEETSLLSTVKQENGAELSTEPEKLSINATDIKKDHIKEKLETETAIETASETEKATMTQPPPKESLITVEETNLLPTVEEEKGAELSIEPEKEETTDIEKDHIKEKLEIETVSEAERATVTQPSPEESLITLEETGLLPTVEEEKGAELFIEPKRETTDIEKYHIKEKLEIETASDTASETERATVTQPPPEESLITVEETGLLSTVEEEDGAELSVEAEKKERADIIKEHIKEKLEIETIVDTERESEKTTTVESQSSTKKYSDNSKNVDALTNLELEKIYEHAMGDKDKVKSDTSEDKSIKKKEIFYSEIIAKDNENTQPVIHYVKSFACPVAEKAFLLKNLSLQKVRASKSRSHSKVKSHLAVKPRSPQKEEDEIIQHRDKIDREKVEAAITEEPPQLIQPVDVKKEKAGDMLTDENISSAPAAEDLNETISIQTITVPSLHSTHRECIVKNLGTEEKVAKGILIEGVEFDEINKGKQEISAAALMPESDKEEGRKSDKDLQDEDVEKEISYPSNATIIALSVNPLITQLAVNMAIESKIEFIKKKQSAAVILLPGSKKLIEEGIEKKQTPVAKVMGYSSINKDDGIIVIGDIKDSEAQNKKEEATLHLIQMETLSVTESPVSTAESNVITISIRKATPGRRLSYLTPPPLKIPVKLKYSKFLLATVEDIKNLF